MLKFHSYDGVQVFKGQAQVQFSTKDEAAEALKKLCFETSLGQNVDPDLYVTKQGRMMQIE